MLKRNFIQDQRGTIAIFFALTLTITVGVTGTAIDYARALRSQSAMQAATDAAATSAAALSNGTDAQKVAQAIANFNSNYNTGSHVSSTPTVTVSGDTVAVSATAAVPTTLAAVLGVSTIQINGSSAAKPRYGDPICMLALDTTMEKAIGLTGDAVLRSTGCAVHSNSTHNNGLHTQGGADATATSFCSTGGVSGPDGFAPEAQSDCPVIADPYANLTPPSVGGCDENNLKLKNTIRSFTPRIFCNDLNVGSGGIVHFAPGTYVIKDGGLIFDGGAIVTGTGVTFYFVGNDTYLNISSSAVVNLSAPTSGTYEGLVFYQDPTSNPGQLNGHSNKINGSGAINIVGSVYFPTQAIQITGGATFGASSPLLVFVANNFIISSELHLQADTATAGMSPALPRVISGSVMVN